MRIICVIRRPTPERNSGSAPVATSVRSGNATHSEYDELKRKLEGEKSRGNPNLLQCGELEGWTQDKTAKDLGIHSEFRGAPMVFEDRPEKVLARDSKPSNPL